MVKLIQNTHSMFCHPSSSGGYLYPIHLEILWIRICRQRYQHQLRLYPRFSLGNSGRLFHFPSILLLFKMKIKTSCSSYFGHVLFSSSHLSYHIIVYVCVCALFLFFIDVKLEWWSYFIPRKLFSPSSVKHYFSERLKEKWRRRRCRKRRNMRNLKKQNLLIVKECAPFSPFQW